MVKKFYRPAVAADFNSKEYDELPFEVRMNVNNFLNDGDRERMQKAVSRLYKDYGYTMDEAKKQVRAYRWYLLAKKDFEEGKSVFIEYSDGL